MTGDWRDDLTDTEVSRFWTRTRRIPDGCWLWTGPVNERGYGVTSLTRAEGSVKVRVHRLAFFLANGHLADDLDVDHLCNVRRCVRPSHLEQVSHAENVRRAAERRAERRPLDQHNATASQPVLFLIAGVA